MDWKSKLQAAKQAGGQLLDQKTEKAIEEHWPEIQRVFREKVGPAALAAAKDDETMQSLFKLVYMALPFPVHLAIKEDAFIKFCFERRDRLMPTGEAAAGEGQL
jgi:hypothetical protein